MADDTLKQVARIVRRAGRTDRTTESDRELLDRFRAGGDPQAFAALVRRHGRAVQAACRHVLADPADVDDAFQATFLVLVKKAKAVDPATLGGWLFGVAHRLAVRARADARRRGDREAAAAKRRKTEAEPPDLSWREAVAVLHDELDRLPDRYRRVLLLCYLDGRSREEAAADLGWEPGAVKGCLERGRKLLGGRLARRGIGLSAGLLAVVAGSAAAGGPRPELITITVRAAGGAVSPAVAALARGGIRMGYVQLGSVIQAAVLAGAVGLAGWGLWPGPATTAAGDPRPATPSAEPPPAVPAADKGERVFSGQVLGPDKKPVAGATVRVAARVGREAGFDPVAAPAPTGPDGRFRFAVAAGKLVTPATGSEPPLAVVATSPGLLPGWAEAREDATVRLAAADQKVAGRLTTLEGRPVAGGTVRVTAVLAPVAGTLDPWLAALKARRKDQPGPFEWEHFDDAVAADVLPGATATAQTDADGRFELSGYGHDRVLKAVVEGPGLATRVVAFVTRDAGPAEVGVTAAGVLYFGAAGTVAAPPGRAVTGVVRDRATGQPLAGVTVTSHVLASAPGVLRQVVRARTDAAGRYTLDGMPKGPGSMILAVPGPADPHLGAGADVPDPPGVDAARVDFDLARGVWIEGTVRDDAGRPVPHARVGYFPAADNPRAAGGNVRNVTVGSYVGHLTGEFPRAGSDGRFRLVGLPGSGFVVAAADGAGFLAAPDRIGPGGTAATSLRTEPYAVQTDAWQAVYPVEVPADDKPFRRDAALETGTSFAVTVVDGDGRPVAGALSFARVPGERWAREARPGEFRVEAFNPKKPRTVLFRHAETGLVGRLRVPAGSAGGAVRVVLRPGVTLAGRVLGADGTPRPGLRVEVRFFPGPTDSAAVMNLGAALTARREAVTTDADGRFRVAGLLPGQPYVVTAAPAGSNRAYIAGEVRLDPAAEGVKDLGDLRVADNR